MRSSDAAASSPIADGFDVRAKVIDGAVVLAVSGVLDVFTAPRLVEEIDNGIASALIAVIVDLSELDFLASAGMTVLLDGDRAAGSAKRFGVVADGPTTSRPMKMVGLDQELRLYSTLNAALTDAV